LVIPTSTGNIERHVAGDSQAVLGVFNGCFYTDPTTQKPTYKNYYPGSVVASDITAFVVDDPDAVFLMDADEAFTRANLYANYSVTNTTGVTQTGISKVQLDVSATGTASTFVVQAIDISQDPDNSDTATSNANILVRINNHFYRSGTGI
jgi:Tfp pilus assembly protein PilE